MRGVNIGGPIVLGVLGLILALAVRERLSGVDLTMIGWILAGAGALWLVLSLIFSRPGKSASGRRERDGSGY